MYITCQTLLLQNMAIASSLVWEIRGIAENIQSTSKCARFKFFIVFKHHWDILNDTWYMWHSSFHSGGWPLEDYPDNCGPLGENHVIMNAVFSGGLRVFRIKDSNKAILCVEVDQ